MPVIKKQAILPYSAKQMYSLVDDIPAYPEFLSWCTSAKEHQRSDDMVRASLTLASHGLEKQFTTVNLLQPYKIIEISLADGPFKHLQGFWKFHDLPDQPGHCQVSLDLDYVFNSTLLQLTFGPVFNKVANTLVQCFCDRGHELYGNKT